LDLHVLGGGKGESIVLRLPDGRWGVVDCYAPTPGDTTTNPTIRFLRDQGVERLEFVCLTHAHDDHFSGMARLIDEFKPREFWRFGALSHEHIKNLIVYLEIKALGSESEQLARSARELMEVFARAREGVRTGSMWVSRATARTVLYPRVSDDPGSRVRIDCLAPSGNQVELYEEAVLRCIGSDGRIASRLPHSEHNRVSLALRITYDETCIILGGDLEKNGWLDVIAQFGAAPLAASAVKVSHHGSTNGYCENLWAHFNAIRRPIAVITPYHRFRLPKAEALEHIAEFADEIYVTWQQTNEVERTQTPGEQIAPPLESRIALFNTFGARPADDLVSFGRCTLRFDDRGECQIELAAPAHQHAV
jgi:beta-lactamase superfamily II metal-dependent hydrolase